MNCHPKTFLSSNSFSPGSCLEAYTGFTYALVYLLQFGQGLCPSVSCCLETSSVSECAAEHRPLCTKHIVVRGIRDLTSIIGWQVLGKGSENIHTHNNPSSIPRNFHLHELFSSSWKHHTVTNKPLQMSLKSLGTSLWLLNHFKIHILTKKDGKFGISQKQSTASGPNLDLFRPKIPEILKRKTSNSSGDGVYQLLRTQLGKPKLYVDQNPRQFNHSLLTSTTAPLIMPARQKQFYIWSPKPVHITITFLHFVSINLSNIKCSNNLILLETSH